MNNPLLKRAVPRFLAWTGLILFSVAVAIAQDAGAPAAGSAPQAGQRTDGQIEMDVVHALDTSRALKSDLITAATIQGEVTLSGTVSSEASSELAESIAAHVAGVSRVQNNLKVGNPQAAQAQQNAAADAARRSDDEPGSGAMAPIPPPPAPTDGPMPIPDQGQAQQQPYPPQPAQRPGYYPPAQAYEAPRGPVTIPQGTLLQVRTSEPLDSKHARDGAPVQFTVIQDVAFGGVLAIPRGATVHGVVTESKKAGDLGGSAGLALKLTSLDLGGRSYPLDSDEFKVKGPNKAGQTVGNAVGGAILGAIIGGAVGRGSGAAIGAGAGAAAGTAASAASPGPRAWIPAEARVDFHLMSPLTVTPVSQQEAARLAQGLYPGGPTLYRRGYYPYGPYARPYAVAYPYYGYPPVFYRPYYRVGGFYYWR